MLILQMLFKNILETIFCENGIHAKNGHMTEFISCVRTIDNMAERYAWTDEETWHFLNLIQDKCITSIFDWKR